MQPIRSAASHWGALLCASAVVCAEIVVFGGGSGALLFLSGFTVAAVTRLLALRVLTGTRMGG